MSDDHNNLWNDYCRVISADRSWGSWARISMLAAGDPRNAELAEELHRELLATEPHRDHVARLVIDGGSGELGARITTATGLRYTDMQLLNQVAQRAGVATTDTVGRWRAFGACVVEHHAEHGADTAIAIASRRLVDRPGPLTRTDAARLALDLGTLWRTETAARTDAMLAALETPERVHLRNVADPNLFADRVDAHPHGNTLWRFARLITVGCENQAMLVAAPDAALVLLGANTGRAPGEVSYEEHQIDQAWSGRGTIDTADLPAGVGLDDIGRCVAGLGGDTTAEHALEVLAHTPAPQPSAC